MFILEWLLSFGVKEWLTEMWLYVVALALIAIGFYLAFGLAPPTGTLWSRLLKPIRWLGFGMMFAGLLLIGFTFGRSQGAASCEAAWKAKNYEAQIAQLHQEASAKSVAAASAEKSLEELREKADAERSRIADYQSAVDHLSSTLVTCRRASRDDDRRVCELIGNAAPGCANSR